MIGYCHNMNTTNIETTETSKLPFPSHVKAACPNSDVQTVSREVVDTSRDLNSLFKSAGNVHNFVRTHYVDTSKGIYGIERLIAAILADNGAIFPQGIETTEFRSIAIGQAMFVSDIIAKVRETFGSERYPDGVIHSYLSYFMQKANSQNKVGKIKLTNAEDASRHCNKPRTKFYLVDTTAGEQSPCQ